MKRIMVSAVIFIVVFVVSYIGLCYLVPGLRIKLAADAATYFKESIRHMIFLKSVISLVIGFVLASSFYLAAKREV